MRNLWTTEQFRDGIPYYKMDLAGVGGGGGAGDILFLLIPPERKSKDQPIYQRDVDKCVRIL